MMRTLAIRLPVVLLIAAAGCTGNAGGGLEGGPQPSTVGQFQDALSTPVQYPARVAVAEDGTVFVTDVAMNAVFGTRDGVRTVEITDLDRPLGIAVRGGRLYVGNQGRQDVEVYDLAARKFVMALGATVQMPNGIAVAADGTVYVADSKANDVKVFGTDGALQGTLDGLRFPVAVAVDDTRVVVADQGNHRLAVFSRAGDLVRTLGGSIPVDAKSVADYRGRFTRVQDVALNGGDILVLDSYHAHVQVLDADGASKGYVGGNGAYRLPLGIAVDAAGALVVTDPQNKRWVTLAAETR